MKSIGRLEVSRDRAWQGDEGDVKITEYNLTAIADKINEIIEAINNLPTITISKRKDEEEEL